MTDDDRRDFMQAVASIVAIPAGDITAPTTTTSTGADAGGVGAPTGPVAHTRILYTAPGVCETPGYLARLDATVTTKLPAFDGVRHAHVTPNPAGDGRAAVWMTIAPEVDPRRADEVAGVGRKLVEKVDARFDHPRPGRETLATDAQGDPDR